MIIDLRYHVVSLVAVFLALGLGIVIGLNLGKTISFQFEKQLEQLETTYQKIRDDQKVLQASLQAKDNEIEIAKQFQKAIIPNLVANRLIGKRIAIIRTNDSINLRYAKELTNLLRQSGAEVTSITSFNKTLNLNNSAFKTELVDAFDLHMADDRTVLASVSAKIIKSIILGQNSSQLAFLQNKDLVQLWGDYNRGYIDTIIFFGGGMVPESNHQNDIDLPLLEAARKTEARVIGVEPSFALESYIRLYQSKCATTIDNIDTSAGEASLVYLLASGRKGHYGIKDTARALIPDFKLNY